MQSFGNENLSQELRDEREFQGIPSGVRATNQAVMATRQFGQCLT